MGEIADLMLTGVLCECCGAVLRTSENPPGVPIYCSVRCARDRQGVADDVIDVLVVGEEE